ncbi:hypothetical protein FRC08_002522 [Ceratobasidium sp. 394]|nr:hypothetical protein FRC08_002522 [Ceratobasidium sp. 394]
MAREVEMRYDDESDGERQTLPPRVSQSGGGKGKEPAGKSRTSGQVTDMSTLFVDESEEAITFCVQLEEFSDEDIQDLKSAIKKHGGTVVSSYRVADYVLVDQSTPAGANYVSMHTTPTRRVVSKDFIQESINRRKLVPYSELTLFVKEDKPVVFCLHESLEEADSDRLRDAILLRGGDPNGEPGNAQVVIRRADWERDRRMKAKFKNIIRLESLEWLESCIQRNRFSLGVPVVEVPVQIQNAKPGRPPGRPRNEFTKKDDQFLIAWIATHFGYSMAGRAGNRAYMDMMEIPEYKKWSQGHTWHSWRERYKKKKKEFDPLIEAYIAEHGTAQPGEGPDEEAEPPVIERVQGAYKKPRRPKGARKRKTQDDGIETDGSHHSDESYRPEKDKAQQPEADEEENRQDVPEKPTSSQARAKKRARIDSETHVIKTSLSQKAQALSQKPSSSSQKPSSSSQKPSALSKKPGPSSQKVAPASQKPALSSQKPIDSSQKAAALSQKPAQQPASPTQSPRHSSPPDNPTPPRTPSPVPPPVAKAPEQARLKATQSMATTATATEESQEEETQDSMHSSDGVNKFVDPALLSPGTRAIVAKGLGGLQLSGRSQEEDEDVDVGGVSQYQQPTSQGDEPLPEDVERQLAEMAEEYNVSLSIVKGQFEEAVEQATTQDDPIEITRDAVEEMVRKLRS